MHPQGRQRRIRKRYLQGTQTNMSKKIIRSKYYKYPTLEERNKLKEKLPNYVKFKFGQVSIIESKFELKKPLGETSRKNNLHSWNITLSNRLGKLKETHLFLLTHFGRDFKENHLDCNEEELVDHILFDYYAEIFYYFYFSTRDTIAQLLNVYFDLGIPEGEVKFKSVIIALDNIEIKESLELFYKLTEKGNNYRNSLTHKFPITQKDYRSEFKVTRDGNEQISIKGGEYLESDKILLNINEISSNLSKLLIDLKNIIEKQEQRKALNEIIGKYKK